MFRDLAVDGLTTRGRKFFNVDVRKTISSTGPFTDDFLDQSTMTSNEFVVALADVLHRMESGTLPVTGMT
jgi:hypothetical protein